MKILLSIKINCLTLFVVIFILVITESCSKKSSGSGSSSVTTTSISCSSDTVGQSITLYGMTSSGGANNLGTIFTLKGNGTGFQTLYSFSNPTGSNPIGTLCKGNNGLFYGLTTNGGVNSLGTIFSFNPNGNIFSKIYDFSNFINNSHGSQLGGGTNSLVLASDGKLYAAEGGDSAGIICLDPALLELTLYPFNSRLTNPSFPSDTIAGPPAGGSLVEGKDGKLYGSTTADGLTDQNTSGNGVVWNFDLTTHKYGSVYQFFGSGGENLEPDGALTIASDGSIYGIGVVVSATQSEVNFIFRISPMGIYSNLITMGPYNGPPSIGYNNNVISIDNNNLYSVFSNENGSVNGGLFTFSISTGVGKNFFSFTQTTGTSPFGGLVLGSNGYLYGMTSVSGKDCSGNLSAGTVYRINQSTNDIDIIYGFNIANSAKLGDVPFGNLTEY